MATATCGRSLPSAWIMVFALLVPAVANLAPAAQPDDAEATESAEAQTPEAAQAEAAAPSDEQTPEPAEAEPAEPGEAQAPQAVEPEAAQPAEAEAVEPGAAQAGEAAPRGAIEPSVPVAAPQAPKTNELVLYLGQSKVVTAPWPVKRVSVTEPETADVQVLTPTELLLQGKALGSTDLLLWNEAEEVWQAKAHVVVDLERLKAELARLFPRSTLNLSQSQNTVIVSGMLGRAEHAAQLRAFMETSGLNFVDMTSVAGVQQVMLQVRIAEESRTSLHALGFTALISEDHFLGALNLGPERGGALDPVIISPPSAPVITGTIAVSPVFLAYTSTDLSFFVQALAQNNYLRILAEPTLVALSGEEATFLAGGEFPVPVVRATVLDRPTITVQFKEFGVRLRFRPTVLGDGTIRLLVASEVSQLSERGAIEVSGFFIPSLVARKAETTLELKSGQSFAMAGLIQSTIEERTSGIPGLADLPVIGALFRSIRYEKGETDLVVLATVWLVEPLASAQGLGRRLDDWEYFVLGDETTEAPAMVSESDAAWLKEAGFHLLKGPGAWDPGDWEILQGGPPERPAPQRTSSTIRGAPGQAAAATQPPPNEE